MFATLAVIDGSLISWAWTFALSQPIWVICLVAAVSVALEYIFPPFPGDVLVVCSIIVALASPASLPTTAVSEGMSGHQNTQVFGLGSNILLFLCLQLGAVAGIIANINLLDRLVSQRVRGSKKFLAVKSIFQSGGGALLLVHRFIPGMRALIVGAAVLSGMSRKKILLFGFISAGLWHALLYGIALTVHANLDRMFHLLRQIGTYGGLLVAIVAVSGLIFFWVSKRRAR